MPPHSVYIHIPFCRHRCGYCNFSLVSGRDYLVDRFLKALEKEIQALPTTTAIDTLFYGGGTPSHLNRNQLEALQVIVASRFEMRPGAEVTAECNPNDLDEAKVESLVALGVNRLSLGVQSLHAAKLKRLERDHSKTDVQRAIQIARQQGIASVSMDLIFAAPGETLNQWRDDLDEAIEMEPDHVSTYELTFEKGTQFWNRLSRGDLTEAHEDLRAEMYEYAIDRLAGAGLSQYELSSFAVAGHQCRHNQSYWNGDDYLAFGPGASRFVGGERSTNHQSPLAYMKRIENGQSPVSERERLVGLPSARERLVVGMRLRRGVNIASLESQTGFEFNAVVPVDTMRTLTSHGLVETCEGWCRLTQKGVMLSDSVAVAILGQQEI